MSESGLDPDREARAPAPSPPSPDRNLRNRNFRDLRDPHQILRVLAATPVLRRLPPGELLQLSRCVRSQRFGPGQFLAPEVAAGSTLGGGEASQVFVVAEGWSIAIRSLPDGHRAIVAIRGVGQIAGIERLTSGLRPSTIRGAGLQQARTTADLPGWAAAGWVGAIPVPVAELFAAMELSPAAHDEARALARQRIAELETMLAERSLEITERLLITLRRLALAYGRATALGHALDLPLTQAELAELVGTTRETMNRALRRLAAQGVLALREGRPTLVRTAIAERRLTG